MKNNFLVWIFGLFPTWHCSAGLRAAPSSSSKKSGPGAGGGGIRLDGAGVKLLGPPNKSRKVPMGWMWWRALILHIFSDTARDLILHIREQVGLLFDGLRIWFLQVWWWGQQARILPGNPSRAGCPARAKATLKQDRCFIFTLNMICTFETMFGPQRSQGLESAPVR